MTTDKNDNNEEERCECAACQARRAVLGEKSEKNWRAFKAACEEIKDRVNRGDGDPTDYAIVDMAGRIADLRGPESETATTTHYPYKKFLRFARKESGDVLLAGNVVEQLQASYFANNVMALNETLVDDIRDVLGLGQLHGKYAAMGTATAAAYILTGIKDHDMRLEFAIEVAKELIDRAMKWEQHGHFMTDDTKDDAAIKERAEQAVADLIKSTPKGTA